MDGFLYVHTTHDGVHVCKMANATTLGTLHTRYTKKEPDALAKDTNPNRGFDVAAFSAAGSGAAKRRQENRSGAEEFQPGRLTGPEPDGRIRPAVEEAA